MCSRSLFHFASALRRAALLSLGLLLSALLPSPLLHSQVGEVDYAGPPRLSGPGDRTGQAEPEPPGKTDGKSLVHEAVANAARAFRKRHGDEVEMLFLPERSHPSVIHGFEFGAPEPALAPGSSVRDDIARQPGSRPAAPRDERESGRALLAERALRAFVDSERALLGVPAGSRHALVLDDVHHVSGADLTVVRLRQEYGGLPLLGGAGLTGHVDRDGKLRGILSSVHHDVAVDVPAAAPGGPAGSGAGGRAATITEEDALRAALGALGRDPRDAHTLVRSGLAIAPLDGEYRLVRDLWMRISTGPHRVLVDARTGVALGSGSLLRRVDCSPRPRSQVYEESPVKGSPVPVELEHLECEETVLSGEFVRTFEWIDSDPVTGDPVFDFGIRGIRSGGGIEFRPTGSRTLAQTTIYHHATLFHDWFRELGFDGLDRPFPTVANARECFGFIPCENAYYDPLYLYATGPGLLVFGASNVVNLGLEADTICHEYTHAVVAETAALGQDFFDPGSFFSFALDEAFSDYFSCAYVGDPDLGEYSGRVFGSPPVRDLENDRSWPADIDLFSQHATGLIWGGALWSIREALSQGGADPDGQRMADALAYATLVSLPSNADFLQAAGALLSAASAVSPVVATTARELLADRGLTFRDGEAPQVIERLPYDTDVEGEIAAAPADGLRPGPVQYEVVVPENGSLLAVELEAAGELDLYVRFNRPIDAEESAVRASHASERPGGEERVEIGRDSSPALAPGSWFIAVVSRDRNIAGYRLRASLELASFETVREVSPGEVVSGGVAGGPSLAPVQYRLDVASAAGAELRLELAGDRDVDLLVRRGSPVAIGRDGQLLADVASRGPGGAKTLVLDALTVPPLESAPYYIAVFDRVTDPVDYTLSVLLGASESAPPGEEPIAAGGVLEGTIAGSVGAPRLGAVQYMLNVPDDGESLGVRLTSAADLALYIRRGQRVSYSEGALRFDDVADSPGDGSETLDLDLLSSPALEPGVYYLAVANKETDAAGFELSVTLGTAALPQADVRALPSGQWTEHRVEGTGPGVSQRLSFVQYSIAITSATGFDLLSTPDTPGELDLYIRRDRPVQIVGDRAVADFRSEQAGGAESITLPRRELTSGIYYIGIVSRSPTPVRTQLLAYYPRTGRPLSVQIGPGDQPSDETVGPANPGRCVLPLEQFFVEVPAAATELEIHLDLLSAGPLQLLVRYGHRVLIDQGQIVADQIRDADEGPVVIRGSDLRPGQYFFTVRHCRNFEQLYHVFVRLRTPGDTQEELLDGVSARGTVAAVSGSSGGKLHNAQYLLDVGADIEELVVSAWGGECALEDVDLLVAAGRRIVWNPDGTTNADWRSTTVGAGAETLVIHRDSDPPLSAGRYHIGVLNRERAPVPFTVGAATLPVRSWSLTSGEPVRDGIGTLGIPGAGVLSWRAYRIDVAPGVGTLVADLSAIDPDLDIDLYGRFGLPVGLRNGRLIAETFSGSLSGVESIAFPAPGDCLRPGQYFMGVTNWAPVDVAFDLVATVGGEGCLPAYLDDALLGTAEASLDGTPRGPALQYCVSVEADSSGFQVEIVDFVDGNLDLYLRRDAPVEFAGETVTADFRSEGPGAAEAISVPRSRAEPGEYFLAVASRESVSIPFIVWITSLEEFARELPLGSAESGVAEPSGTDGIGWLSSEQFTVDVPAGLGELAIELGAASSSRLELHVRRGERVEVVESSVLADRSSAGGNALRVAFESPAPGTYYVAVRNLLARSEPFLVSSAAGAPRVHLRRADCNRDGAVDVSDAVVILRSLFSQDADPDCGDACDANDDGELDISDVIGTLEALFLTQGTIPSPGPGECGVDPTDDALGCRDYGACP